MLKCTSGAANKQDGVLFLPGVPCFFFLCDFRSRVDSELSGKYRSRRRRGVLFSSIVRTNDASIDFKKCRCSSFVQVCSVLLLLLDMLGSMPPGKSACWGHRPGKGFVGGTFSCCSCNFQVIFGVSPVVSCLDI